MSKFKKSTMLAIGMMGLGALATSAVQAHPRLLIPSHFTVSKEGGDWLTFDITGSHGTFVFDTPGGIGNPHVVMPDGRTERPPMVLRGKRRSVFDFHFVEQGTHKVAVNDLPKYITMYKAGRRDTVKRIRASKAEREALLPEKSRDVSTMVSYTRAESYITVGTPTDTAFKIEGKYLEMVPVTHPSDIVEGEPVTLQFYYNGELQQGVKAEITKDGTLYRNQQQEIKVESDADGKITFTPPTAGRYLMKASYAGSLENDPLADKTKGNVHLTFEAVLQ